MRRFCAPADETPNAFGGWFEHVRAFEAVVAALGPKRACVIEYEQMHTDLRGTLARLAVSNGLFGAVHPYPKPTPKAYP